MNFKDLKTSFLKKYYPLVEDIFFIFDTQEYSQEILKKLAQEAKKHVESGFLFQTSGTTSDKKFVLHDFKSIKTSCTAINSFVEASDNDVFFAPISIHHMGGFSVLARSFFANAEEPIVLKKWSLEKFIQNLNQYQVTITSMVPSQIFEIVQNKVPCPDSLRIIFVGGSAIDHNIFLQARELGWPVLKTFGSSEACSQIYTQAPHDKRNNHEQKLDTSSNVKDHFEYKTLKSKNDSLVQMSHWSVKLNPDQRLMIRGESLYKGYLILKENKIEFQITPKDKDDYFLTEDMVKISNGKLEGFLGRINDFVKINSTLVHMAELRKQFYKFCLDQKIDPEKNIITIKSDVKNGLYLVTVSELESKGLIDIIQIWNEHKKSAERIRGLYFQNIPRTELGKIKYSAF